MKHEFITSFRNQNDRHLSGQQLVNLVQSGPKVQQSAGKVMASVFWDVRGVIFIDYLEKGNTINSEYYIALFERLKAEIAKKTNAYGEEKKFVQSRLRTVSQVNQNNSKTT